MTGRLTIGRLRLVALLLVGLSILAAVVLLDPLGRLRSTDTGEGVAARDQAEIALATLSSTNEADGALVVTERRPVVASGTGAVTSLPTVGGGIEPGAPLFSIDEVPAIALPGVVPGWRSMTVDDIGVDVAQLEAALVDLGYDPDGILTVDDTYTDVTASIVERWQEDAGLEVTGTVQQATVVFVPDGAVVASVEADVGQTVAPGSTLVVTTTADRLLQVTVAADQRSTVEVGTVLAARLPDRSTIEATVIDLVGGGDGTWVATARLVDTDAALPEGEAVPVTVSWNVLVADQVPTVQAGALTRLDAGGYAVEVAEPDGTTRFVPVELGERSGSTVELITDLPAGTSVISP